LNTYFPSEAERPSREAVILASELPNLVDDRSNALPCHVRFPFRERARQPQYEFPELSVQLEKAPEPKHAACAVEAAKPIPNANEIAKCGFRNSSLRHPWPHGDASIPSPKEILKVVANATAPI
jgi:hypothetical protein